MFFSKVFDFNKTIIKGFRISFPDFFDENGNLKDQVQYGNHKYYTLCVFNFYFF